MDLSRLLTFVQIVSGLWTLFFGSKSIYDFFRGKHLAPGQVGQGQKPGINPFIIISIVLAITVLVLSTVLLSVLPPKPAQPTQPSFPLLHASYSGTMFRTIDGATFGFGLYQVSENQNTGAFTASAIINGCPANVSGNVTQSGSLNFTAQESSACRDGGLVIDFTGNITSSGSIGGSWGARTANIGGTWNDQ